jgi:hypothetical protein
LLIDLTRQGLRLVFNFHCVDLANLRPSQTVVSLAIL